nr:MULTISPECIES: hypothetical protein [Pseudomonas putida group]
MVVREDVSKLQASGYSEARHNIGTLY